MTDDLEQKQKILEENLHKLLKFVNELDSSQSIKIYQNLITTLKTDIEKIENPNQKCSSCGSLLDPWEKGVCGPCKISDNKIPEEEE